MQTRILPLALACLSLSTLGCGTDEISEPQPDAGVPGNDAGTLPDAGADAGTDGGGQAISADPGTWTWVEFPESACGNGAPTGIGINPLEGSTELMIYLQGGGACWNEQSCFFVKSATYIETGYGEANFQNESFRSWFMVDRSATENPFAEMSYVFVPYCTGDVHSGDAVATYGSKQVHHKGAANMEAYLTRLAATFPDVTRIFLTGSSAGAYGAQINYERVAQAFPNAEVHLLADSGQMINPSGTLLQTWLTNWKSEVPEGCPDCATDFTRFPAYLADTYQNRRFGLLAWDQDQILSLFFGYTREAFAVQTLDLLDTTYDGRANAKYFLKLGTTHTMLGSLDSVSSTTGVALNTFVTDWVEGAATWESEREQAP